MGQRERLTLGGKLLCATAAVSWWNGLVIPAFGHPGQLLFVLALAAIAAEAIVSKRALVIPRWLIAVGLILAFDAIVNQVFPISAAAVQNDRTIEQITGALGAGPVDTGSNLANLLKLEIALIVVPATVYLAAADRPHVFRKVADCWAIGALTSAAVAIIDAVTHIGIGTTLTGSAASAAYTGRQQGLSEQPNHLAVGCLIVLPVVATWLLRPSARWQRAAALSLLGLLGAIYVSGSRAALVAAPVALIVICTVLAPLRRVARSAIVWGGLIVTIIVAFKLVNFGSSTRLGSASGLASDQARGIVRKIATHQFTSRPLEGAGFTFFQDAHNIYLQILASSGLLGAVAFLIYAGGVLTTGMRALHTRRRLEATVMLMSLGLWLILGIEENNLADLYLYVPAGLLLSMFPRYAAQHARAFKPVKQRRWSRWLVESDYEPAVDLLPPLNQFETDPSLVEMWLDRLETDRRARK